ncbi:hypothetical protein HOP50_09g54990 [Chloropicon primus]|uniref:Uncharacterized protein n=1 Tax=Chloropicon primus TaxID=1764295 RepID=A0A5B8MQX3_9CHLO|nr:hypothetical protein A3770_09p54670 [Chloropicon primus]UPR02173.1 hypothetical protein HOP50_09g54990 [Chloropicon primus]|eukprot:QDZ22949.1 hypothetical protein A3770_09p54670 [Chloropicon primus]
MEREEEKVKQCVEAAIDLIRLAGNPQAKWSAESLRNAISWLDSTEAWAKQHHTKDIVRRVIQQVSAVLPDGKSFVFESLITARDVFVKNLVFRPCSQQGLVDMIENLKSIDCERIRSSIAYYTTRVYSLESQLQVSCDLLHSIRSEASQGLRKSVLSILESEGEDDCEGDCDWSSFLDYLLSWRIVCLSAFVTLQAKQAFSNGWDFDEVFFSNPLSLDPPSGGGLPNALECCCILLLARVWYHIIHAAHSRRLYKAAGEKESSALMPSMAEGVKAGLLARMISGLDERGVLFDIHPGLLATLCLHCAEFRQPYERFLSDEGRGGDDESLGASGTCKRVFRAWLVRADAASTGFGADS